MVFLDSSKEGTPGSIDLTSDVDHFVVKANVNETIILPCEIQFTSKEKGKQCHKINHFELQNENEGKYLNLVLL